MNPLVSELREKRTLADEGLRELLESEEMSLLIEILQLPFFQRTSDIDDLILNTAGVMVGYGFYALASKATKKG